MAHLQLRGVDLGPVRAVLFDKDGTLSHSEPLLIELAAARIKAAVQLVSIERQIPLRDLLQRAYGLWDGGIDPAGTTAVASRAHNLISTATAFCQVGLGWAEALSQSEAVFALSDSLHGLGSRPASAPTAGLMGLLASLQEAGVRCGVISNDERSGIQHFLECHGLQDCFQAIWSAEHHPCKPDPAAVHGLCNELGIAPSDCALIGDADSDLSMAALAGVPLVIGFADGWSRRPSLSAPHLPLERWSELTVIARD
ncbi:MULTISPECIES: HAD family hydrolase [unclassified Synechococcus]|uniref:HAD family hydrolase n=1 Tax=unclassified Synechococcus TaxID=2626047 RepID=UPI0021A5D963|nr:MULTISPECIES: HAD family hydrolase [unclassified Synechococcus]MCT0214065.1 HAD family hydrolase [Synechococcus sp. CS-1326]MCT0234152.1 HAD family hydrolase [Synechococcus sp. CS-1327]